MTAEREALILGALRAARHRPCFQGRMPDGASPAKKGAAHLKEQSPLLLSKYDVPEYDVIEFDELYLRQSPPLCLWVGVCRRPRQVLGLALGDRTDEMLVRPWRRYRRATRAGRSSPITGALMCVCCRWGSPLPVTRAAD